MPDNQNKRQHGIESLLVERKKYEAWLAQLDTKRESTAEHVFTRVHADYTKRLDDVQGRLAAEADGIKALVSELDERLATEQRLVTEKSDERSELELRATVGEFSEKEWNSTRGKLDAAIDEIRGKLNSTERELVEMREILASVVAAPPAAEPAPTRAVTPRISESVVKNVVKDLEAASIPELPKAEDPIAEPAKPEAPPVRRARTPFDELAFLKSVAGVPTTPTPMPAVPDVEAKVEPVVAEVEPPVEPDPEPVAEVVAEADVESYADPIIEPMSDATTESSFEVEPEPSFGTVSDEHEAPKRGRPSSKTPLGDGTPLGAPTPRTSQAIRSLKCQECDTLNFPTEWYCERCGGELAAF